MKNFHQIVCHEYESLKFAFKRLNLIKAKEIRKREFAKHMLMCEKYTRDQAEIFFWWIAGVHENFGRNIHILINEKSQILGNGKVIEHQLNYASLFTEKKALRHEKNKILLELTKRENTISSLQNQLLHHAWLGEILFNIERFWISMWWSSVFRNLWNIFVKESHSNRNQKTEKTNPFL